MNDGDSTPTNENALRAFETLHQFLEEDEWYPQKLKDRYILRVDFAGRNAELTCYAQIRDDLEQFLFYVMAPVKVPEELRAKVAEFIARANYGLRIGSFEMDFEDGEVRYKSSLDFEDADLTPILIRNTIYPAVQTMDRYMPGLMQVLYSETPAADAIHGIEHEA